MKAVVAGERLREEVWPVLQPVRSRQRTQELDHALRLQHVLAQECVRIPDLEDGGEREFT